MSQEIPFHRRKRAGLSSQRVETIRNEKLTPGGNIVSLSS